MNVLRWIWSKPADYFTADVWCDVAGGRATLNGALGASAALSETRAKRMRSNERMK